MQTCTVSTMQDLGLLMCLTTGINNQQPIHHCVGHNAPHNVNRVLHLGERVREVKFACSCRIRPWKAPDPSVHVLAVANVLFWSKGLR